MRPCDQKISAAPRVKRVLPSRFESAGRLPAAGKGFVNPYRLRLLDFPGRVFTFLDREEDRQALDRLIFSQLSGGWPIEAEIGSGSGAHLIGRGALDPQAVCIGFELRFKRAVRTIEKSSAAGVANTYVLNIDGRNFDRLFPDGVLSKVFVNFPDPWEKKRQRKHRMLDRGLLDRAVRALKPGGSLEVKTDHLEYFREFAAIALADPRFEILGLTEDLEQSDFAGGNIPTEFEKLFTAQGIKICRLEARLRADYSSLR